MNVKDFTPHQTSLLIDVIDVIKENIKTINKDSIEFDKRDIRALQQIQDILKN